MAAMNFNSSLWNRIDYRDLTHFSLPVTEREKKSEHKKSSLISYIFDIKPLPLIIGHVNKIEIFHLQYLYLI